MKSFSACAGWGLGRDESGIVVTTKAVACDRLDDGSVYVPWSVERFVEGGEFGGRWVL